MSRRRRIFDIDLPEGERPDTTQAAPSPAEPAAPPPASPRRGPMATAIGETGDALRRRKQIEADIRAENDALAHEFVRLKKLGLITDVIPPRHDTSVRTISAKPSWI
jgi:ParB family chromosome partitioning protein